MSSDSDLEYYARRAADEWVMAKNAKDATIASLHRQLAERYVELADRARLDSTGDHIED